MQIKDFGSRKENCPRLKNKKTNPEKNKKQSLKKSSPKKSPTTIPTELRQEWGFPWQVHCGAYVAFFFTAAILFCLLEVDRVNAERTALEAEQLRKGYRGDNLRTVHDFTNP